MVLLTIINNRHSLCGTVEIAANEDMTEHQWSGTGKGETKKEEQEWNIPGNVVHYKVVLDEMEKSDEKKKAWSMRVSGVQKGRFVCWVIFSGCGYYFTCYCYRFETSYSLLHILLGRPTATPTSGSPPTFLPIVKLWPNLIAAACELTGDQRIKVIGIILQLLLWNSSAHKQDRSEAVGGASASASVQRLDLAMLKPLWSLYTAMSKDYGMKRGRQKLHCLITWLCSLDKGEKNFHLKPEILRALTELFLVVENTALDWRMEQDLLVETITEDSLSKLLEKVSI